MTPMVLQRILRRSGSLFQKDLDGHYALLRDALAGARLLVIGAAGSIGSAFVKEAVRWSLGGLRLIDPSENNLVELVRDLRASGLELPLDFATSAIALGSVEFDHFLAAQGSFDYVVNFAALKHVRAERDPFTLMRMIDVNLLALDGLLLGLAKNPPHRFFSVSSDKAVNPANLMGASKGLMEQVMWLRSAEVPAVTARFANVAFSDGSLLYGFERRLAKRQPISAPVDVKRYFISHQEAGQLCLLACVSGNNREIYIPKLDADEDLMTFAQIAEIYLDEMGFTPRLFATDQEAREFASTMPFGSREWPCRFSASDTTGEKEEEEFCAPGEWVDVARFAHIGVITAPDKMDFGGIQQFLETMKAMRHGSDWEMAAIVRAMVEAVPDLRHLDTGRDLDAKM